MPRRTPIILPVIVSLLVVACDAFMPHPRVQVVPSPPLAFATPSPTVLVIVCDDCPPCDVGAFRQTERGAACPDTEYAETPNIDALAERGVVFTSPVTSPACAPSRAALHTSRHAGAFPTMRTHPRVLPDTATTLGDVMQEAGYSVGCFGKDHLGVDASHPMDRGCTRFFGWDHGPPVYDDRTPIGRLPGIPREDAYQVSDSLLAWHARTPGPKLILYQPSAVHHPHHGFTGTDREKMTAHMARLDSLVGRLPEAYLTVFVSDNGPDSRYKPHPPMYSGDKGTALNGGVLTFAVWAREGAPSGAEVRRPVWIGDVPWTIAERAGASVPAWWSGRDLFDGSDRYVFGLSPGSPQMPGSVHTRPWSYVEGEGLFSRVDLLQENDVSSNNPAVASEMQAALDSVKQSVFQ